MISERNGASPVQVQQPGSRFTPACGPVDAGLCAGRNLSPATGEDCVGLSVMRVQEEVPPIWFEEMMPKPYKDVGRDLLPDPVLTQTLQDPVEGLKFYYQQVQRRGEMEARHEEYTFAPLLVTLHNMNKLTEHMLENRQFARPLAADEHSVLLKLQQHIQELIRLKAPYKRTVKLALLMCMLQEIITARHVIKPLRAENSELLSRDKLKGESFLHWAPQGTIALETTRIPLEEAFSCRWGGLNTHAQQHKTGELISGFCQDDALMELLEDHRLFMYPAFAPLDLNDFCDFGHLPFYPLGMMSDYALNADGRMRTPLGFFVHDVLHTNINKTWLHLDGMAPLESIDDRLRFQQAVRGGLPAAVLAEHKLERALELIVFYLFHERPASDARHLLESNSFLLLFATICEVRRREHLGYSRSYRAIKDKQALLACFWVYRVYSHYRTGTNLADTQVSSFVQQDVPALLEHQRFIDQHQQALHQHFLSHPGRFYCAGWLCYPSQSPCASSFSLQGLPLEASCVSACAAGTDTRVHNTDLVYLDAVLTDEEAMRMEQALGVRPPASCPHRPVEHKVAAGSLSALTPD